MFFCENESRKIIMVMAVSLVMKGCVGDERHIDAPLFQAHVATIAEANEMTKLRKHYISLLKVYEFESEMAVKNEDWKFFRESTEKIRETKALLRSLRSEE